MSDTFPTQGDTTWFVHDRFGLFIHWGLYALAGRHEWVKQYEQINDEQYTPYFKHFDPDLYHPQRWATAAASAGMKYFVITTKHHEGFCLWDSKLTDYKATHTSAGRDLLKPMVDAFREQNMRVGFYHSLIDWHHPDFPIDSLHPQRNHPDKNSLDENRQIKRYTNYLHSQVRELLTGYGPVDILWLDYSYPNQYNRPDGWVGKGHDDWQSEKLVDLVRELAPNIILNDRLDLPVDYPGSWDIKTPEQYQPRQGVTVNGQKVVWEACQTFSGSWGYFRDEASWKSTDQLIHMLIDTVSKDGNLLLNVGPTGRGEFDERVLKRLEQIGQWMYYHSRSIYGCTSAPKEFLTPQDCRLTWNPEKKSLYVHLLAWPFKHLHLDGLNYVERVEYAQLLNDASELKQIRHKPNDAEASLTRMKVSHTTLTLELPVIKPNVAVPVIELFLK